jgi:hypothetical protein
VPAAALWPGFLVASVLAFDRPKGGRVEELSELAYAICLALFMLTEVWGLNRRAPTHPSLRSSPGPARSNGP